MDGPTSGSGPDRATMRGPAPVALVDLDDHGLGVEHLPQPADELGDQLRRRRAGRRARTAGAAAGAPAPRGPRPPRPAPAASGAGGAAGRDVRGRHREPRAVGAVLLVPGAPRRRELRQQLQPAPVRGGPAVAAARLGQVLLQWPGSAVAHRDERPRRRRCAARPRTRCPRAARSSRRARSPAARRCPRRRPARPRSAPPPACAVPAPGDRASGASRIRRSSGTGTLAVCTVTRGVHAPVAPYTAWPSLRFRCGVRRGGVGHDDDAQRRAADSCTRSTGRGPGRRRRAVRARPGPAGRAPRPLRRPAAARAGPRRRRGVRRAGRRCWSGATATCCGSAGSSAARAGCWSG